MLFTHLDLEKDEKVVHEVRKHWYIFFWRVIVSVLLLIGPVILYIVTLALLPTEAMKAVTGYFFIGLFAYALWFLVIWVLLFIQWTNYYLDVWYITDKRIVDIQQKGIFHRQVSNLPFDKIQDISVEVRGLAATFLKYGDLRVQTASEYNQDFILKDAAHPEEARKIIFSIHNSEQNDLNDPL